MSTLLRAFDSQRLWSLLVLGVVGAQLSGCVIFREPVETPGPPPPAHHPATGSPGTPTNPYPAVPAPPIPVPAPTVPPPTIAPPATTRQFHLGPAATALVAQAHRQAAAGDPQLAISTIERALRIEPDNPLLWLELGESHETAGHYDQAAGMGHKALQLATGDPHTQSAAWRLIADSLKARGRNAEAAEAQHRADELAPQ